MSKFFDKILASMGNIKAMERLHVDDHTEKIINDIEGHPFAISDKNVMYAGPSELGGFYFLQTIIVGNFNIKTVKGAKLELKGDNFEIQLDSDMVELQSDFSNVSNRFITKIDFQIEKSELESILNNKVTHAVLYHKNTKLDFKTVPRIAEISQEEE